MTAVVMGNVILKTKNIPSASVTKVLKEINAKTCPVLKIAMETENVIIIQVIVSATEIPRVSAVPNPSAHMIVYLGESAW